MSSPSEPEVSIEILGADHFRAFQRALLRTLRTEIAEQTFAEILDGMLTKDSYLEFWYIQEGNPVLGHLQLCPGVVKRVIEFRSKFEVTDLRFSPLTLQAFQDSPMGSKTFHLRLIELLARSCHQIAVYLFQSDDMIHKHDEYRTWAEEPRDMEHWDSYRPPTPFTCRAYVNVARYPNGLADVVGYWAEVKIFGGVVLFDRGESDNDCKELYLHGPRRNGPSTIFALTPEQYNSLLQFLLDDTEPHPETACPLPMLPTFYNRWRWDPWDAFAKYHIFRDRYERQVPPEKPSRTRIFDHDWPELSDRLTLLQAMYNKSCGDPINVSEVRAAKERMQQVTPSSPCWHNGRHVEFEGLDEESLQAIEKEMSHESVSGEIGNDKASASQ